MSMITSFRPRTRRNVELVLLLLAVAIVLVAYLNVGLAMDGAFPPDLIRYGLGLLALSLGFHLVLRWRAAYADPVMLPIATLLNGLGLVMIHRLDEAYGRTGSRLLEPKQLIWSALAVLIAAGVIIVVHDHRQLRRFTFTAMAVGLGMLLLPLLPVIGRNVNGSRIWIGLGPLSFQPGEIGKILLVIFFAGYLVQTRDVLSLVGHRFLGIGLPRAQDLGPILIAWMASVGILVFENDLGFSRCCSSVNSSRCSTWPRSAGRGSRSA